MHLLDITPRYPLSPHLFMQFMEPLGTTDSSVEAGWDFTRNQWRPEVVEIVRRLAPAMIRWGGIYTSFWKWREGVGPRDKRKPAINYLWGGLESNQVGVDEFLDFCALVGAEPLIGVNFAADGRPEYIRTVAGEERAGTPDEAADLVRYCNDPDHPERKQNGRPAPWAVTYWQVGNETSYPPEGKRFTAGENARHFLEFARAMRAADPSIRLIGWGDQESKSGTWWVSPLLDVAGEYVDYVAMHLMGQRPRRSDTILVGMEYMKDRERAWEELLEIYATLEPKIAALEEQLKASGSKAKIAITEGHLSLRPHNANFLLHEWLAGLYSAKVYNLYERHGEMVTVATAADFFGTRWTVNAVMVGGPYQRPFLMPAGVIAALYRAHIGTHGVDAPQIDGLDIAASRTGDRVFLHVVNGDLHRSKRVELKLGETKPGEAEPAERNPGSRAIARGVAYEIAPGDLGAYVHHDRPDAFIAREMNVPPGDRFEWSFPPASVTVVELDTVAQLPGRIGPGS